MLDKLLTKRNLKILSNLDIFFGGLSLFLGILGTAALFKIPILPQTTAITDSILIVILGVLLILTSVSLIETSDDKIHHTVGYTSGVFGFLMIISLLADFIQQSSVKITGEMYVLSIFIGLATYLTLIIGGCYLKDITDTL